MMKYVFLLTLLMFGAVGGALGGAAAFRWMHNMTATQRVMPSLSIVEVKEVLPHPLKHATGAGGHH